MTPINTICCKIRRLYPNFLTSTTNSVYAQVFSSSLVIIFVIIIVIMKLCMKAALFVTYPIPLRLIFLQSTTTRRMLKTESWERKKYYRVTHVKHNLVVYGGISWESGWTGLFFFLFPSVSRGASQ
jgi:uncharacterized membrane protein (UPF0182 family)